MARGWESKDVESQQDLREERAKQAAAPLKSAAEVEREGKRADLELSRTRVLRDLQSACNPRYRAQLEQSLKYLEDQLRALD
jgi:hypothetical protein